MNDNMNRVKLTNEELEVLRRLGRRSRKETEKRIGKRKLIAIARAQGHHGKKGGRPPTNPCSKYLSHRYSKKTGICYGCGQRRPNPN